MACSFIQTLLCRRCLSRSSKHVSWPDIEKSGSLLSTSRLRYASAVRFTFQDFPKTLRVLYDIHIEILRPHSVLRFRLYGERNGLCEQREILWPAAKTLLCDGSNLQENIKIYARNSIRKSLMHSIKINQYPRDIPELRFFYHFFIKYMCY